MLAPLVSGRSMLIICPSSDENDILTVSCSQVPPYVLDGMRVDFPLENLHIFHGK